MDSLKALVVIALLVIPNLASPVYEEHKEVEVEHYAHPKYEFKYGVKDPHTGDIKEQSEKRDGDRVEGYYTLVEPDGTTRTVHYSSDKHTGFHAQVQKSGHAVHPAQTHKKVVVSHQPIHVAPVYHQAVHAAPSYSHQALHSSSHQSLQSSHQNLHSAPSYSHQGQYFAQHNLQSRPSYHQQIHHAAPSHGHQDLISSASYSHQPQHSAPSHSRQSQHGGATSYSNFAIFTDGNHKH